MKVYEVLDLTRPDVVVGMHSVWLPTEQIKIPFQWGGEIQKYRKLHEQRYSLDLLGEEVALLRALAMMGWAPRIGEWVYFKTVISTHPGAWWADPCGAYGYEMADASLGPRGTYTYPEFQASGLVTGSPGAWNDLNKPGNVVNGYLIDVRRSGWDRLRWTGTSEPVPVYTEDPARLAEDLHREGQFPFQERSQAYQEYYLDGAWHAAEREVRARAEILQFRPRHDETVLDLGCQLGGFLTYAALRTAPPTQANLVGVDVQAEYVDLARRLARANGFNICYRQMDGADDEALGAWLRALWAAPPTHVLLLSMLKHLPWGEDSVWNLYDELVPTHYYLETNAVKEATPAPLGEAVRARRGTLTGWSQDRNRRACYKVSRGD